MNFRMPLLQCAAFALVTSSLMAGCGPSASVPGGAASPTAVQIRPLVAGQIDRVSFAEGARVRKGQILFRIDPSPFRAETERRFIARNHAISALEQAKASLARAQRLPVGSITPGDLDQLGAAIAAAKVDLAAATAALNASKIDLEFTEIRAPIDGLVSRALIKQGELVSNDSLLTTIVANQADREYLRDTARAAL